MTIDELNTLNSDELAAVIQKDAEGDAEILFALEGELMYLMQNAIFPDSETFGNLDEETTAEQHLRVLIESMDFATTLSAINAIYDIDNEKEEDGEDEDDE